MKIFSKIKSYIKKDKKIFAKGLCFEKLFLIFLIGSIIGAYYEQILNLFRVYKYTGDIVWEYRRGVIYGPFNVIYGFGAVVMTKILLSKEYKWYEILLYGCILGGGIEYIVSFLQETFTHTISWDYSNKPFNINGRTTIPYMFVWGLFCLLFVKIIYPFISNKIEKIPYNLGMLLTKIMVIFMVFNMAISWTAIIRQTLRKNNIPAFTKVGEFYDEYYTDEYLSKYFPNMIRKEFVND